MLNKNSKLLTTEEAAQILGLRPNTLVVWRCTGRSELPFYKIGGSVRYSEADVLAFLESQRVVPTAVALAEAR